MLRPDHRRSIGQQDRAADDIFQLADIAGPVMRLQQRQRIAADPAGLAGSRGMAQQHPEGERGNITRPIAQRRQGQGEDIEAIEQVFAEPPGLDLGCQMAVGAGDHPHIDTDRAGRAQRQHLAFLQGAQQLGLQGQRQFADFVEQQRALVRRTEQALARFGCARERALAMAEQQRFQHRFGHGGAIDRDKRAIAARGKVVDKARQHFLAGAGRPFEQDGNLAG